MIEVLTSVWNILKTRAVIRLRGGSKLLLFNFLHAKLYSRLFKTVKCNAQSQDLSSFLRTYLKNQPGEGANSIELSSDLLTGSVACLPHQ